MKINIRHISFQKNLAVSLKTDQKVDFIEYARLSLPSLKVNTNLNPDSSKHQYAVLLNTIIFLLLLVPKAQATSDQCVILTPPQEKSTMKSITTLFANKAPCNVGNPILGGLIINELIPITEYCNKTIGLFLPYTPYARVAEIFDKKQYVLPTSIERNLDCIETKNTLFNTWGIGGMPNKVNRAYAVLMHLIYNIQKFKDIAQNMLGTSMIRCINHTRTVENWILDPILENYEAENCSNWFLSKTKFSNTPNVTNSSNRSTVVFNITSSLILNISSTIAELYNQSYISETQNQTSEIVSSNTPSVTNSSNRSTVVFNITSSLILNISSVIAELYNQSYISETQNQTSEIGISNQSVVYKTSNHSQGNQTLSFKEEKKVDLLGLGLGLGIPAAVSLIYFLARQIRPENTTNRELDEFVELETIQSSPLDASTAITKTAQKITSLELDTSNQENKLTLKRECLLCIGFHILEQDRNDTYTSKKEVKLLELYHQLETQEEPLNSPKDRPFLLSGEENETIRNLKTAINKIWENLSLESNDGNSLNKENFATEIQKINELKTISHNIPEKLKTIIEFLTKELTNEIPDQA